MSGFLNAQQIESLFEKAGEGGILLDAHDPRTRRPRWLRTVDFSRPTKFTSDQERRIRRSLEAFTAATGTRMTAEHRVSLELSVVDIQQLTWTNALAGVPDGSILGTLDTAPHDGHMLLTAERTLVLLALERLLGGSDPEPPADRELTSIDLSLVHRLLATVADALSGVFFDASEMRVALREVETQQETVMVAAGSEPTLLVTFEAHLEGVASTMSLLIPYAAIAPVAAAFSRHDEETPDCDPRVSAAVESELRQVDITLRVEVADTVLTLEEVLALKPGDVVSLDGAADGEVTVCADHAPIHRARAGRSGPNRAIQVVAPTELPR